MKQRLLSGAEQALYRRRMLTEFQKGTPPAETLAIITQMRDAQLAADDTPPTDHHTVMEIEPEKKKPAV
ncbi:hypothetical protein [Pararhizobium qamdonense]|uniref:hypothetical protein n=1 Tax=Pararhizobium qamdonense TaxID=3031126 RepID=UPI0023E28605|nr:hypothetical protein [Pararhizobium qamdonense]